MVGMVRSGQGSNFVLSSRHDGQPAARSARAAPTGSSPWASADDWRRPVSLPAGEGGRGGDLVERSISLSYVLTRFLVSSSFSVLPDPVSLFPSPPNLSSSPILLRHHEAALAHADPSSNSRHSELPIGVLRSRFGAVSFAHGFGVFKVWNRAP
jgi:hypothetical protein